MGQDEDGFGISVKLGHLLEHALALGFTEPTHYGLGKRGWLTAPIDQGSPRLCRSLKDWIHESHSAVALTKRIAQWDLKKDGR